MTTLLPGRPETRKMFKQYNPEGKQCLNEWRERFVNTLDVTEYKGAIELVGSWAEWKNFKENWPTFANKILPEWLEEVEIRLRSMAISTLCEAALDPKAGVSAAKFIAEGGYVKMKKGRPKKEDIVREARIAAGIDQEVKDDVARVLQWNK